MPKAEASIPAFFANLPTTATAALQAAFDRLQTGGFSNQFIFDGLCRDLNELSLVAPERREFEMWRKAVASGDVERPGTKPKATAERASEQPAPMSKPEKASAPSAPDEKTFLPLRPADFSNPKLASLADVASSRPFSDKAVVVPPETELQFLPATAPLALKALQEQLISEAHKELADEFDKLARAHAAKKLHRIAEQLERGAA